ncbi:hypothetical protein K2173_025113 [Erythroxylum novogranatense]|uniref:Enhancer of polycomb-like protein n=1 Tax=Erythroxylum novogranatense TaxID=1862640 RepID=A0AAV8SWC9_9ROSI|nr:hypothetical protein K2173_025113 [Erythroxylum novogranatense]
MPTVGMRRTTRVFGVVKGVDGARVLRSGRRLFPESGDSKLRRASDGDDWFHNVSKKSNNNFTINKKNHHNNNAFKSKENGCVHDTGTKHQLVHASVLQKPSKVKIETSGKNLCNATKKFGNVYSRKRKRLGLVKQETSGDKMYGIRFSRRQRINKQDSEGCLVGVHSSPVFGAVCEGCCDSKLAYFLHSVLRYMSRASLRVSELASFLFSEPVCGAFASAGIRFLQGCSVHIRGTCKFYGAWYLAPLFSVDFPAIPSYFIYMHLSFFSSFRVLSLIPVNNSLDTDTSDKFIKESEVDQSCIPMMTEIFEDKGLVNEVDNLVNKALLHPDIRSSKVAGRNNQYRNGLNSRGIKKRRSSFRRRRTRNPCIAGVHKAKGTLVSDLISSRKHGIPFSSVVSRNKFRDSVHCSSASNRNEVTSTTVGMKDKMDVSSCSANVLVVECDRCFRIQAATVMLELSDSGEWILVVKKNGSTRYTHSAQKIMRPSSANRITHDVIWTGDENWKLEFPNRKDWFIFKDLYKECSDRNTITSSSKAIPVPGVHEVLDYQETSDVLFTRPDVYISLNIDEVARAMSKATANYDMDSEDEEWLKKFNSEFLAETDCHERLSEDGFELMIDAFEKALYCCPDDLADDGTALKHCMELGKREVVLAVYGYWTRKRKQKRTALLRVFQGQHAKKAPLIPKPVLRKRRSFKRQSSQHERGKQPVLQVITEHDEQSGIIKVEEAKLAAKRSLELATDKRREAQLLMQNADLATYKAVMALRIAEAASVVNSLEAVDFFD